MKVLLTTSAFNNPDLLVNCVNSWPEGKQTIRTASRKTGEYVEFYLDTLVYHDGFDARETFKGISEKYSVKPTYEIYPIYPCHKGVSGSWNEIIRLALEPNSKLSMVYDLVINVGSDTLMLPGFLESVITDTIEQKLDFISGHEFGFNIWGMNKKCLDLVGTFDENFYPAYFEDGDYFRRIHLCKEINYHSVGDESLFRHLGSQTIRSDSSIRAKSDKTFAINNERFLRKWGAIHDKLDGKIQHPYPYNDPTMKYNEWKLDMIEYMKKQKIWNEGKI